MTEPKIPQLNNVIVKRDLFKKNGFDYAPWARISGYLNEKANGWTVGLRLAPDGHGLGSVWQAPGKGGYLLFFLRSPEGEEFGEFPYGVTDFRNQAIEWQKITASDVMNSHRRGFCAAAAYFMSLGFELWAKLEVDEAHEEEAPAEEPKNLKTSAPTPEPKRKKSKTEAVVPEGEGPADPTELAEVLACIGGWEKDNRTAFRQFGIEYAREFKLTRDDTITSHMNQARHVKFAQDFIASLPPSA